MEGKIRKIVERELNAKVISIKRITEGFSHYMYEVEIDKNPGVVIFRFSNNSASDLSLTKEKYIIDVLRKNNLPAPKIYVFNRDYMILEKFKGKRLDSIWNELSKDERYQVTVELGRLLARIHKIKLVSFGKIHEGGLIDTDVAFKFRKMGKKRLYSSFLREVFIAFTRDLSRFICYKHLSPEFIGEFMNYVLRNLNEIDYNKQPVLVHGDFHPGHIFVEKINGRYEIQGLIDFEFSSSYSPEFDFIKMHRFGFFDDSNLKRALMLGYGKINEKAVEIHRLMRDLQFAWAVLESGNKKLSDETLEKLELKLNC